MEVEKMQGSINFDGSLVGNITGGGGGGGDTVVITPVVTSGTKIADVSVNGVEKDLYCPTSPTPTEIDITPVVTSGTKIADVSVGGVEKDLYCPNPPEIDITPVVTSGTKIADVSVNGVEKDLYCPTPPTPPQIDITPVVTSGTKIADVSVGGVEKDLYTPDYGADIAALDGRLDIAEDNITTLTGRVGTAEGNITNLAGHMTEAETDITEMKQSLSQLDNMIVYKDLTPSDDYAEFSDGSNLPLISLTSNIEYTQSGSGTPSPTNPRPISGYNAINVIVSPNSDFSGGTTYTVNFVDDGNPLMVYHGTFNPINGQLTIDRKQYNIDENEANLSIFAIRDFGTVFKVSTGQVCLNNNTQKSNYLNYHVNAWSIDESRVGTFVMGAEGDIYLQMPASVGGTITDFRTWLTNNNIQVNYPLTSPITYQLTPIEILSLLGQNYISSDCGDITNVKYLGILNLS